MRSGPPTGAGFKACSDGENRTDPRAARLFSCLTYDDGARAQQPDLLLQSHPVRDLLLLLLLRVLPRADAAAAVLSIHVRLPGSGPVRPVHCVLPVPVVPVVPVLLSSPHSVFMQTEWAALAQQPAAVQGRMLNTPDGHDAFRDPGTNPPAL